ncbi:MAG: hypothetical protein H8D89_00010 [Dehalococcoidia bacterium]|nr:hypothetical protein [Dehalococcoidia bacterium]MBL7125021.1 hypothetical protein [Dehalococcoidales bacterium]
MTTFRIDVSRETGTVTLWMEAPCGFKPIIGWAHVEGVKEFGDMLLDFYNARKEDNHRVKQVSDNLLRQALGDEK